MGEDAVQPVELAVGTPLKGVERFMGVVTAKSFEQYLLLGALAGVAGIAQEEEIRRRTEEDPAMADLNAGRQVPSDRQVLALGPNRHPGRASLWIFFDDLDAVARFLALRR